MYGQSTLSWQPERKMFFLIPNYIWKDYKVITVQNETHVRKKEKLEEKRTHQVKRCFIKLLIRDFLLMKETKWHRVLEPVEEKGRVLTVVCRGTAVLFPTQQ